MATQVFYIKSESMTTRSYVRKDENDDFVCDEENDIANAHSFAALEDAEDAIQTLPFPGNGAFYVIIRAWR